MELQRANMWKRISAALCDFILLTIVVVGVAFALSAILGYDAYFARMDEHRAEYEEAFGVSFEDATEENFAKLSPEERAALEAADKAFGSDPEVLHTYGMLFSLSLVILTLSLLLGTLLVELLPPLLFGNGQTLGKKVFGLAVMREDGVRMSNLLLFARTLLGKYTVELMLPVLSLLMLFFNVYTLVAAAVLILIPILQLVMLLTTRERALLHDKLAHTAVVDMASQRIFDSAEALLAYKEKIAAERAERADY